MIHAHHHKRGHKSHHNVGTCLRHVSTQAPMYQRIENKPKEPSLWFAGRPSEITDDAKAWMISIACQRPAELGYAQELWTLTSLHKYIQKHAEEAGYPRLSTVTKP